MCKGNGAGSIRDVITGIVFFYSLLHARDRAWGGYVKQGCGFGPVRTSVRDIAGVIHVAFCLLSYCPHSPRFKIWWNDSDMVRVTATVTV